MIKATNVCHAPKKRKIYFLSAQNQKLRNKLMRICLWNQIEKDVPEKNLNLFLSIECENVFMWRRYTLHTLKCSTAHFCDFETGRIITVAEWVSVCYLWINYSTTITANPHFPHFSIFRCVCVAVVYEMHKLFYCTQYEWQDESTHKRYVARKGKLRS